MLTIFKRLLTQLQELDLGPSTMAILVDIANTILLPKGPRCPLMKIYVSLSASINEIK